MTNALLAAESIGKSFGNKRVLSSAGLWAKPGCLTALLGRNGSGKTTLIRIATGWLRADHGVIIFKQRRMIRPHPSHLARSGLCYIPEQSWLCPRFRLADQFDAVRRCCPGTDVAGALELLRVEELIDRKPGQLSGGEKRRADIALGIARCPECLLIDEPFFGLSPTDAEVVTGAIRSVVRQKCAVVITGHEVDHVLSVCDEVLWQTAGTTRYLGTARDAAEHHQFRREYLGASTFGGSTLVGRPRQAERQADRHDTDDD